MLKRSFVKPTARENILCEGTVSFRKTDRGEKTYLPHWSPFLKPTEGVPGHTHQSSFCLIIRLAVKKIVEKNGHNREYTANIGKKQALFFFILSQKIMLYYEKIPMKIRFPEFRFTSSRIVRILFITGVLLFLLFCLFRISHLHPFLLSIGLDRGVALANPHNPDAFFSIGENSFGQGRTYNPLKAEKAYSKALELRPDFLEAHYQLGRVYFIQGRFHQALVEIMTVLRLNPEFKKAYYMYGLISGYQMNYNEAIYGFSEFIKRDDFNWAGYNDLAWIYFQKGDYEKTRDTAKEGLRHAETNPWLQNISGTALMNLGETEEARKAFRIALRETELMTPEQWGGAYPGNDPKVYAQGLEQMRAAIKHNLELLES